MYISRKFVDGFCSTLFAGGIATQFPNQILLISLAAGLGGCAFFVFQKIHEQIRILWFPLILSVTIGSIGALYYTVMYDEYTKGQALEISVTRNQRITLRAKPNKNSTEIKLLDAGTPATYISKSWRRIHFSSENGHHFEYWRKIMLNHATTGWIYGAYLTAKMAE